MNSHQVRRRDPVRRRVDEQRDVVPRARFDNVSTQETTSLGQFIREIRADSLDEVRPAMKAAEHAARTGHWVAGFVTYEAASAFDVALDVARRSPKGPPLAWFGVFATGDVSRYTPHPPTRTPPPQWSLPLTEDEYGQRIDRIHECIRAGDVYQVNFTARMSTRDDVEPVDLYQQLLLAQSPKYGALIEHDDFAVVSASPELFFEWHDSRLRCRPMKGTQRRGRFGAEDDALAAALVASAKEQSENIMIVDLVRNDMAKVATLGSVKVQSLLELEEYPNVFQLVSEVSCRTPATARLEDIFAALFPCGSVTGAPKHSAMSLISSIEDSPRGVYCGAVGLLEPTREGVRATFNVAIRTAVISPGEGAKFGTGGGIVMDSHPSREFSELVLKAHQLKTASPRPYRLLETFRHHHDGPGRVHERHLDRMRRSARRLSFRVPDDLDGIIERHLTRVNYESRIRVLLSRDGRVVVQHFPAPESVGDPVTLCIDVESVSSDNPMLFHKTTQRDLYLRRRRRFPDVDDVVMVNERGECTEVTTANLAIRQGTVWRTPPLSSGCLPGIARELLLERGEIEEWVIRPSDVRAADEIAVFNSLRGWRRAILMPSVNVEESPTE